MTPFVEDVMAKTVNLDALIPREDMQGGVVKPMTYLKGLQAQDLKLGSMTYSVLRKPDFQRSTASWTPEKVRDLVVAYMENELIPAVILWRSPKNDLFVIDGSHRLSSLIAWVNDDYGDGPISKKLFGDELPEYQKEAASLARQMVLEAVGPFDMLSTGLAQDNISEKYKENAKKLVFAGIQLQELTTGEPDKAEKSFFKINEQGVALTETEKLIIHSRACPNSIAARAISQRGTGYPHWKHFANDKKTQIETLAKEVHTLLFEPPIPKGTIKTSNLPILGNYSPDGLGPLFNTISLSNKGGEVIPKNKEEAEQLFGVDSDGTSTIEYLKRTKQVVSTIANRMATDFMNSLDLHPFVYFYAENGRHQPSNFLAVVEFLREWEEKNHLLDLTRVRSQFEEFLVVHRWLIPQISRKARGEIKAVHRIKEFFTFVANEFLHGERKADILDAVILQFEVPALVDEATDKAGKRLTPARKSARFIIEDLRTAKRCLYCKARVPDHGISFDHIKDKKHGGLGSVENAGMAHHYCNGAKDLLLGKGAHKSEPAKAR